MKKLKICIFNSYFKLTKGGSELQSYYIAQYLDKNKYDVFFISFDQSIDFYSVIDGYKIYNINVNKTLKRFLNPYFLYFKKIKTILKNEKPDIVYRRMGSSIPGLLCLLKKGMSFKLVWACAHINELNRLKLTKPKFLLNIIDDLFRIYGIIKSDKIIVQSYEQMKLLKYNFNRNSVLVRNFHPILPKYIKKDIKSIQIIWIANLKIWKQPDLFIKLAKHFQAYENVTFIMIGRPGIKHTSYEINAKIKELKNISYIGEQSIEVVNKLLSESHIFINTSLYEGFPNTFIQAWIHKVPVLSLYVDPDNLIKNNKIGFHSLTFEQLIQDTKLLIHNDTLRHDMGEKAYKFAIHNFTTKNLRKLIQLFDCLYFYES